MSASITMTSRGLFGRNLVLSDLGVRRGRTIVAWDEVDHYVYDWQDWRRPGDILLVSRRRRVLRIAPMYDRWHEVADRAFTELHGRLRDKPFFDPLDMDENALVHLAAGRLPLVQIEHIEIASIGPKVIAVVHTRGGGQWAQVDASDIANFWLWIELLVGRDVPVLSSVPLYLPPVLSPLGESIATTDRVPRARLV